MRSTLSEIDPDIAAKVVFFTDEKKVAEVTNKKAVRD
jgi:hypothetical protein